jgi:transposase
VKEAGCKHEVIKTGSGPAAAQVPAFKWVNTAWQHQGGYRRNLPGHSREAPALGDLGYRGKRLAEAGQALGITVEAIARGREGRFVPAGICWVVERSFAWISRYRRLNTIFERSKEHLIAFVAIAFISILARRLKCLVAEDCSA